MNQQIASDRPITDPLPQRQGIRDEVQQLLMYASYLALPDRALIRGVYEYGVATSTMAQAVGRSPRVAQDRLRRLTRRIGSPLFRFVVQYRLRWPHERRAIADAVVLRGETQRMTAMHLGISVYFVRRELDRIQLMCQRNMVAQRRRGPPAATAARH